MPTPLELAAAAESEKAAIECCAQLLRYANASEASKAAARRVGNDAVVALLETPLPPQDEPPTPEPQDKPPPAPKPPLTVGAAHARGRLLGRKLFRAVSNEDAAAAGRLLGAVERKSSPGKPCCSRASIQGVTHSELVTPVFKAAHTSFVFFFLDFQDRTTKESAATVKDSTL